MLGRLLKWGRNTTYEVEEISGVGLVLFFVSVFVVFSDVFVVKEEKAAKTQRRFCGGRIRTKETTSWK